MNQPAQPKSMEDFQKEFRGKFYGALAAAIIAGFGAALLALWGYIKTIPSAYGLVPPGAIVAFWSEQNDEHAKACPTPGWSPATELNGRVIVGAGKQNESWQRYLSGSEKPDAALVSFTERKPRVTGGEETHLLTEAGVPAHDHSNGQYTILLKRDGQYTVTLTDPGGTPNLESGEPLRSFGGSKPHNNMPPFMALYYCKKN